LFDIIIRGGTVFDGTGQPGIRADVGVAGERIAAIGDPSGLSPSGRSLAAAQAGRVIEASGLFVAPGFIDMHTHSDVSPLLNPRMESKIRQGVTLEVCGNCGDSLAPLRGEAVAVAEKSLAEYGYNLSWRSMGEYLQRIAESGMADNLLFLVGHGTLRAGAMGFRMGEPTADELATMQAMLAEALEDGAWGMSTGLIYPPSSYATTAELVELSKVVARYGGLYASHIRNEGEKLLEAVAEAIAIGQEAGVPVQLAHHKAAGRRHWGKVKDSLALIAQARAQGLDVTADQYPYTASSTGLDTVLPGWVHEGGSEKLVARLQDAATRAQIAAEVRANRPGWENPASDSGWHNIVIAGCKSDRALEGLNVRQIADQQSKDPVEVVFDLLTANEGNVSVVIFSMCEEDVQMVMRQPFVFVGSDATCRAPYGPLAEGKPHPRTYGTFPRLLGRYVRELGVLTWEEAIAKMTGRPAAKLGLAQRGTLAVDNFADIVVFDPATIADRATFTEPMQYPAGIPYVIVNGVLTIDGGEHTGATAGRVLRRRATHFRSASHVSA